MGANGTPWVSRCSVTRVITPPLISPGNRAYRGYALTTHGSYRPAGGGRGRMIAGSLRPFTTRASHNVSAEGANEMVKTPPGRCRQDRIAAGRFPQPLVSISQSARSGRCGSRPLAFAGDDQPRQFP